MKGLVNRLSCRIVEEICNGEPTPTIAEVVIPTLQETKRGDDLSTDELIGGWIADLRRDAASAGARSVIEVLALAKIATHEVAAVSTYPCAETRSEAVTATTPRGAKLMGKIKNSTTLIAIVAAATLGTAGAAAAQIGSGSGDQDTATVQGDTQVESIFDIEDRGYLMNADLIADLVITSSGDDSSTNANANGDLGVDVSDDDDSADDDSASVDGNGTVGVDVSDDDGSVSVAGNGGTAVDASDDYVSDDYVSDDDVSDDDDSASVAGNGDVAVDVSGDDDSASVAGNGDVAVDVSDDDDAATAQTDTGTNVSGSDDSLDASIDLAAEANTSDGDDTDTDLVVDAGTDIGIDDDDITINVGLGGGLGL